MPRPSAEPTQTVSVCVSPLEQTSIREAAAAASSSVSTWAAAALAAAIGSAGGRTALRRDIARIAATATPKGTRSGRVSTVLRIREFQAMREAADKLDVSPHALVQAALIGAAAQQLDKLDAGKREAASTTVRNVYRGAGDGFIIHLPPGYDDVDPPALAEWLDKLSTTTAVHILDGKGRAIAEGVAGVAQKYREAVMTPVKVPVQPMTMEAPAHVLGVPSAHYATAMACKAINAMRRAAKLAA